MLHGTMNPQNFRLPSGTSGYACWEFSRTSSVTGLEAVVFLLPASRMRGIDGRSPGCSPRYPLRDLAHAFVEEGFAVFRFETQTPPSDTDLLTLYAMCLEHPRVDPEDVLVIAFQDGADRAVQHFYDFFPIRPWGSAILVGTAASPAQLNLLTCPYLVVHGERDPLLDTIPHRCFEEAVHRHQMRYGDVTERLLVSRADRDFASGEHFDPAIVSRMVAWAHSRHRYPDRSDCVA